MQEYDHSLKCLSERFPEDFIKYIFGEERKYKVDMILQREYRTKKVAADFVVKIAHGDSPFILHIEFESSYGKDMPLRMLNYYTRIVRKYKLPVYSVVLYLNPKYANRTFKDYYDGSVFDKKRIFEFKVIKAWKLDASVIIDNKLYGLYPLLPLIKDADIKNCLSIIDAAPIKESLRKDLHFCTIVLAGLKYDQELLKSLSKEDIMKESSMYQYLFKDAIEEGMEKGEKKGIEKSIISVLRARFKRVPKTITTKIKNIKDNTTLEKLLVEAVNAKTIKDFEKKLNI